MAKAMTIKETEELIADLEADKLINQIEWDIFLTKPIPVKRSYDWDTIYMSHLNTDEKLINRINRAKERLKVKKGIAKGELWAFTK